MFHESSLEFNANRPLYVAAESPVCGFVTLFSIEATAETEQFSKQPFLTYEMEFFEMPQHVVMGLN